MTAGPMLKIDAKMTPSQQCNSSPFSMSNLKFRTRSYPLSNHRADGIKARLALPKQLQNHEYRAQITHPSYQKPKKGAKQ